MKRLKSISLLTGDVPGLRDFYAAALELNAEGDDSFVVFSTPDLNLSICAREFAEQMAPGSSVDAGTGACFLEFEVEDVDREYLRLQALQAQVIKPPTTQPWGLRSVWFCDPDGNKLNFFAHVAQRSLLEGEDS
jgi:predicted enzyme related to lactoylglutathione lyase